MKRLDEMRDRVDRRLLAWRTAKQRLDSERQALSKAEQRVEDVMEAQALTQRVAQKVQQEAHDQIAGVVTRCLETVFGEGCYNFKINFRRQRGRTEAQLLFDREGLEVDPLTASGGGVVDVAAFALRLSCLLLSQPKLRRLLVLDEPFKFLSMEYRDRVRTLLELLSVELGVQILMVTHITELRAGHIVQLDRVSE